MYILPERFAVLSRRVVIKLEVFSPDLYVITHDYV